MSSLPLPLFTRSTEPRPIKPIFREAKQLADKVPVLANTAQKRHVVGQVLAMNLEGLRGK